MTILGFILINLTACVNFDHYHLYFLADYMKLVCLLFGSKEKKKKINGRLNTCLLFTLTKYDVLSLKIIKCDFYWNVKGWTIGIWLLNNYKNWVRIKKRIE